MDVEKLQRINNLARELMTHGMAGSMDEAVRIAEEKIRGDPEVSIVQQTMQSSQPSQVIPPANDDLQKVMKLVHEQQTMIGQMGEKINELISEFNGLQEELHKLKTVKVEHSSEPETQAQLRPQPVVKKDPHARSGAYNPEDVQIEDIFYSGVR